STSKTPSYTKSVSWQHHPGGVFIIEINKKNGCVLNFLHSK
ncbi:NTF2 fold immunity protein, partial [Escherichia coli]